MTLLILATLFCLLCALLIFWIADKCVYQDHLREQADECARYTKPMVIVNIEHRSIDNGIEDIRESIADIRSIPGNFIHE